MSFCECLEGECSQQIFSTELGVPRAVRAETDTAQGAQDQLTVQRQRPGKLSFDSAYSSQ